MNVMRRRGFTIWEVLVILAGIGIVALILYPIFDRAKRNSKKASCQSNLKQMGLGVSQYVQDYNEKFPLVNVNDTGISENAPLGWADALHPYVKSRQIFWCPHQVLNGKRDETEKKPSERDYTDYFYNRRLAGIEQEKVKNPGNTILLGDGNDGTDAANARYSLTTLPAAWRKNKSSPSHRHGVGEEYSGANYAFADGHVKWLDPKNVTDNKPDGENATFAIK